MREDDKTGQEKGRWKQACWYIKKSSEVLEWSACLMQMTSHDSFCELFLEKLLHRSDHL